MSRHTVAGVVLILAACGSPPAVVNDGAPADAPVAPVPDAPPPDAMVPVLGPSLVVDIMHIASLTEDAHAFSLLGQAVNPQLQMAIDNGQLLLGLELRMLDDPSGQDDPELTVGLYTLVDTDMDPSNNFDPDAPEFFNPAAGGTALEFPIASIVNGTLHAEGAGALMGLPIPLPLQNPEIDGDLVPGGTGELDPHVHVLENARLRGAVPAQTLALLPNITGGMCPGGSMLDVLALGCGFFALQPDVDLDGDGLETFFDTENADTDAGVPTDGVIDRCVDGDGTEVLGTTCVQDPRFADGYRLIFVIHGVRATILAP